MEPDSRPGPGSCWRLWIAIVAVGSLVHGQPAPDSGIPLTRIADVKTSLERADQPVPVLLEGVVTCPAMAGDFFLHDGLGIHVGPSDAGRLLKPGDRVRVAGVTRRGAFAPSIEPYEIVRLGRGVLPNPRRASINEIASGALDGQWLQMEGVGCEVNLESSEPGLMLTLAVEGRKLRATVGDAETLNPDALIDAEVRVQGVASGSFNRQRQLVEPMLRIPGASFVTIVRPAPADAFSAPLVPLGRLLGFSLQSPNSHRVRIRAAVTRCMTDGVMFVRGEALGLKVKNREPALFTPGDVIEAAGFPMMSGGAAVLENAVCRVVASGAAPAPAHPEWSSLFDGSHHGDLVTVRARLVDWVAAGETLTLVLQAGNQLFRATLPRPRDGRALPETNSIVDVTGICEISGRDDPWHDNPRSVMLLLSTPADIAVIERPDWWTAGRLWRALALVLVLLVVVGGWVWSLRREVERKRMVIEQQARHAAVLEERSRIARDLHDTLEQGLTGLSLQLKVVEMDSRDAPEHVGAGLEGARQMLRQSRALAHNAIRELRTNDVARRHESLVAGLHRIAETWRQAGIDVTASMEGSERAFSPDTEANLVSIAAEAITNAVKHGRAAAITVTVHYRPEGVRLQIDDNGAGFDSRAAGGINSTGFGLIGMRERAEAIGARLEIGLRPGGGTRVAVDLNSARPAAAPSASAT